MKLCAVLLLLTSFTLSVAEAEVDRDSLMPEVEYASAVTVPTASWVEMHFRGVEPASLDSDVRTFYRDILPGVSTHYQEEYFDRILRDGFDFAVQKQLFLQSGVKQAFKQMLHNGGSLGAFQPPVWEA